MNIHGRGQALPTLNLLGGHVGCGSRHRARHAQAEGGFQGEGQSEIRDVRPSLPVKQDVRRLQVPMQQPPLVRVVHPQRHIPDQCRRLRR